METQQLSRDQRRAAGKAARSDVPLESHAVLDVDEHRDPVGLLLGGALGNLADRAREGAVIDWIDPTFWPAFNVADACIVIGVLLLLWVVEGRTGRPQTS